MQRKYLEYSDSAISSHKAAQVECEQKDILISQLRSEIYRLRELDDDFQQLNKMIGGLESKYVTLMDEKERIEKQQKTKFDIDKNAIISLREEIDELRVALQKCNLQIEDLLRENTNLKRIGDSKTSELNAFKHQIKEIENQNYRTHQDNKSLVLSLRSLKEQRKRLEEECDGLSAQLDESIAKLKLLEKDVRSHESNNAKLEKTLHQADKDNQKLLIELKDGNEESKRAEQKLKGLQNTIKQLDLNYQNIQSQTNKNKAELQKHLQILDSQIIKGKQYKEKVLQTEASIRSQQNELDQLISQEEQLRRDHFSELDRNKQLNTQIDHLLALINEYESVNRELLEEIQISIDTDQQARGMLDRKAAMRQTMDGALRRMELTGEAIRHLKC